MFENQNPTTPNQNQAPVPPAGGSTPPPYSGMPLPPAAAVGAANKPAQDMFSEVEPPAAPGNLQRPAPVRPAIFQPKPTPSVGGLVDRSIQYNETTSGFNLKRILVLGGLVLALAAIVGGGYWGYKKYSGVSAGNSEKTPDQAAVERNINNNANSQPVENLAQPEAVTEPAPAVAGETGSTTAIAATAKDSDDDGLTDEEEAALGTNPNAVDSDNDGLFDREEVKVYGTDPLKADTDGDGYNDGTEVKGGFNPLGFGKLFDTANPSLNKP